MKIISRKLSLLSAILFLTFNSAIAQNLSWQNPLPQGNNLSSVYFPNATTGYIVGDAGTILKTTDAGTSWTTQISGTFNGLTSVCFIGVDTGYAIGGSSTILKTTDGGNTWVLQAGGLPLLTSVFFTNANIGYAVGGSGSTGKILKTTDGGIN